MTQTEAASISGIDRKTLAKIDRGEDVKEDTLQRLAKKLNVPATHFEPPAGDSLHQGDSQPDDPKRLNLVLRNADAERLAEMLSTTEHIRWQLNVRTLDDETIQSLEQLEDAVNKLHAHLTDFAPVPEDHGTLRYELAGLKMTTHVASVLKELAKHRLAILGAEYLVWSADKETVWYDETPYTQITYISARYVVLSVEAHPAPARRARVWQGDVPPKFAPNDRTIILVNGVKLDTGLDDEIPF